MFRLPILVLALVATACSSPSNDGGPDGGASGAACTPAAFSLIASPDRNVHVVDIAPYKSDVAILLESSDGALSVVTGSGSTTAIASESTTADISGRADGEVCVIWTGTDDGIVRACSPDFIAVPSAPAPANRADIKPRDHMHAVEESLPCDFQYCPEDGTTIAFFQGASDSADAAYRDDDGWSAVELFESSVSSIGDATAVSGAGYGCLLAAFNQLGISGRGESDVLDSTPNVRSCRTDAVDGVMTILFRDGDGQSYLGSTSNPGARRRESLWTSAPIDIPLSRTYDLAVARGEIAIAYVFGADGDAPRTKLVRRTADGDVEYDVDAANGPRPRLIYDTSGGLVLASLGTVAGTDGLGTMRICPER